MRNDISNSSNQTNPYRQLVIRMIKSDTYAVSDIYAFMSRITVPHHFQLIRDRIRSARELAGLNRAELARKVGVAASAAVQWEHENGTAPTVENLSKIAQITQVSFEWLATGRGTVRISDASGELPALNFSSYAQDIFEEQLLLTARKIPSRKRLPVIRFLEDLFGK